MIDLEQTRPMKERVAACVGIDEMERARLRLLLRLVGDRIGERWRMGEIEHADLLFIGRHTHDLEMLVTRARGQGIRCIIVGGDRGQPDMLPVPLEIEDLVWVLANPGAPANGPLKLADPDSPEFFTGHLEASAGRAYGELVDFDKMFQRDVSVLGPEPPRRAPPVRQSRLDELLPGVAPAGNVRPANPFINPSDPAPPVDGRRPEPPPRNPFLKAGDGGDAPDWSLQAIDKIRHPDDDPRTPIKTAEAEGPARPLVDYLKDGLLVGPSRLEQAGLPPLVIDPKWGNFYFHAPLAEAKAYLSASWHRSDWRPVTNSQLQKLREHEPGKKVEQLLWLDALLRANGFLPRHLDPGGTYRLWRVLDVGEGFDMEQGIAQQLLEPHRLHEVVAATGASMPDVFNVVAAYDAVGLVDWTRRDSLR